MGLRALGRGVIGVNRFLPISILAVVFLAFAGGLFIAILKLPPTKFAEEFLDELQDNAANIKSLIGTEPSYHLHPAVYPGDGVVLSRPDKMQPGVTLLTGLFGNRLGFRMVDARGKILHDWPVDFFKIDPEEMKYKYHALIHGTVLYPNGDIVANLDERGMVRVNKCGTVLWRDKAKTHHSIEADDDGGLWAPALGKEVKKPDFTDGQFLMDAIVRVDPVTGKETERFQLIDVFDKSDRLGIPRVGLAGARMDITHTNDVEPLPARMAAAFPMFAVGDILVSSRNLNLLFVIDRKTRRIKWTFSGPMQGQHDPDFQPDGTITVLDNLGRSRNAASRILSIDPRTGTSRTLFRGSPKAPFFTPYRGKHQILDNHNILIAETDRGRAFEVTPGGEVVWSYINRYDDTRIGWLVQADRYPASYAVNGSGCGRQRSAG